MNDKNLNVKQNKIKESHVLASPKFKPKVDNKKNNGKQQEISMFFKPADSCNKTKLVETSPPLPQNRAKIPLSLPTQILQIIQNPR